MPIKLIEGGTKSQRLKRDRAFFAKEERRLELERRDRIVQRSIERQAREDEEYEASKGVRELISHVRRLIEDLSEDQISQAVPKEQIINNEILLNRANKLSSIKSYLETKRQRERIQSQAKAIIKNRSCAPGSDPNKIIEMALKNVEKLSIRYINRKIKEAKELFEGVRFGNQ